MSQSRSTEPGTDRNERRVVLHAGLPKTGTSALQDLLDHNRAALLRAGVWYPRILGTPPHPHHAFLIQELRRDPALPRTAAALQEGWAAGAGTAILSIEGLSGHADAILPAAARRLTELTRGCAVTIFVATRPLAAWSVSMYRQSVVNPPLDLSGLSGLERTYGTGMTARAFADLPEIRRICSPPDIAARYAALFPEATVVFEPYDRTITRRFADRYGLSEHLAPLPRATSNVMPADPYVEILRQTNPALRGTAAQRLLKGLVSRRFGDGHSQLASTRMPRRLARLAAWRLGGALDRVRHEDNAPLEITAEALEAARLEMKAAARRVLLRGAPA